MEWPAHRKRSLLSSSAFLPSRLGLCFPPLGRMQIPWPSTPFPHDSSVILITQNHFSESNISISMKNSCEETFQHIPLVFETNYLVTKLDQYKWNPWLRSEADATLGSERLCSSRPAQARASWQQEGGVSGSSTFSPASFHSLLPRSLLLQGEQVRTGWGEIDIKVFSFIWSCGCSLDSCQLAVLPSLVAGVPALAHAQRRCRVSQWSF